MKDARTVQQIVIHALVPSVQRMVVIVHAAQKRMVPDVRKSVTDVKTVRQVVIHALAQNATKRDAAAQRTAMLNVLDAKIVYQDVTYATAQYVETMDAIVHAVMTSQATHDGTDVTTVFQIVTRATVQNTARMVAIVHAVMIKLVNLGVKVVKLAKLITYNS